MAVERHGRMQRKGGIHLAGGPQSVEGYTGPHHIHLHVRQFHDGCAVGAVAQGKRNPTLLQHIDHPAEEFILFHGMTLIRLIRPGKMRENSLRHQMGKPADCGNLLHTLLGGVVADPMHAGVHLNMNICAFSQIASDTADFFRHIHGDNRQTHVISDQLLVIFRKGISQNQHRLLQSRHFQLQRLLRRGHRVPPETVLLLQIPADGAGSVAVSVRLDHSHDLCLRLQLLSHGIQIFSDRVQIDPGADPAIFTHHMFSFPAPLEYCP